MNAANTHLGWVIALLEEQVKRIELRQCWYVTLKVWAEHLDEIEAAVDASLAPPVTKSERKQRKALKRLFDWNPGGGAIVLARLAEGLMTSLPTSFGEDWRELRAIEVILDEVAAQFDGVDPLTLRNREAVAQTRQKLVSQKDQLEVLGLACELREAEEEDVEPLRLLMANAQR